VGESGAGLYRVARKYFLKQSCAVHDQCAQGLPPGAKSSEASRGSSCHSGQVLSIAGDKLYHTRCHAPGQRRLPNALTSLRTSGSTLVRGVGQPLSRVRLLAPLRLAPLRLASLSGVEQVGAAQAVGPGVRQTRGRIRAAFGPPRPKRIDLPVRGDHMLWVSTGALPSLSNRARHSWKLDRSTASDKALFFAGSRHWPIGHGGQLCATHNFCERTHSDKGRTWLRSGSLIRPCSGSLPIGLDLIP
jgi:hypothetical protein